MFSLVGFKQTAYHWVIFISSCVVSEKKKNMHVHAGAGKHTVQEELEEATDSKKQCQAFSNKQSRFIVESRLELQPFFDDKLHKNDQLWDRLATQFKEEFPETENRDKFTIRAKFEQEQNMFCSFCRLNTAFRAGHT